MSKKRKKYRIVNSDRLNEWFYLKGYYPLYKDSLGYYYQYTKRYEKLLSEYQMNCFIWKQTKK